MKRCYRNLPPVKVGALLKVLWHIHFILKEAKAKVRWNDCFLGANWEHRSLLTHYQGYSLFSENSPSLSFEVPGLHKKVIAFVQSPNFWEQVSIFPLRTIFSFTRILPPIAITECSDSPLIKICQGISAFLTKNNSNNWASLSITLYSMEHIKRVYYIQDWFSKHFSDYYMLSEVVQRIPEYVVSRARELNG